MERVSGNNPVIILVEPQLGENIGAAVRAMANFGLSSMRLVAPRDGWPNPQAKASASGADHVLEAICVFDTVDEAIADLHVIYATTRRRRDLAKPVVGPVDGVQAMIQHADCGKRVGILFGRERWGLTNDEVALADEILTLPVVPEFASLNIAQAVLAVAYEWRKHILNNDMWTPFTKNDVPAATKEELLAFFKHLERALDAVHFFRPPEKRTHMVRNLRVLFQRAALNGNEVRTLRGVIAALEGRPPRAPCFVEQEGSELNGDDDE